MRDITCEAQLLAISPDESLVQQQRQALSDMATEALAGPAHMLQALQQQFDDLLQLDVKKYCSAWAKAHRSLEQDLQEIGRWQQVGCQHWCGQSPTVDKLLLCFNTLRAACYHLGATPRAHCSLDCVPLHRTLLDSNAPCCSIGYYLHLKRPVLVLLAGG